jgi:hypothetical protein
MELLSEFRTSALWNRQCLLALVPTLPKKLYLNPFCDQLAEMGSCRKMGAEAERKQHISGDGMWSEAIPCLALSTVLNALDAAADN